MARVTERVRLGPAALNPFTLHPYEIAGQIAMLDRSRAVAPTSGSQRARGWIVSESTNASARRAPRGRGDRAGTPRGGRGRGDRRAIQPLARDAAGLPAVPGRRAAPRRHLGARHRRLGGIRRQRAQGRRERQPGTRPGRPRVVGNENVRLVSAPSASSTRTEPGLASVHGQRSQPYVEVVAGLDPTVDRSALPELARFCIAGTPEEVAARSRGARTQARIGSSWNAAGQDQIRRRRADPAIRVLLLLRRRPVRRLDGGRRRDVPR